MPAPMHPAGKGCYPANKKHPVYMLFYIIREADDIFKLFVKVLTFASLVPEGAPPGSRKARRRKKSGLSLSLVPQCMNPPASAAAR